MTNARLALLRFFALLFLLPGIAGLIGSAVVSTHYLDSLPRLPDPAANRVFPRGINGTVIYQTEQEDQRLSRMEHWSIGVFGVGLVLGLIYLEKWGSAHASAAGDEDQYLPEHLG